MSDKASLLLLCIFALTFMFAAVMCFGIKRGAPVDAMRSKWKLTSEHESLLKVRAIENGDADAAHQLWEYYYRYEPAGMNQAQIDEWAIVAARLGNEHCKEYVDRYVLPNGKVSE